MNSRGLFSIIGTALVALTMMVSPLCATPLYFNFERITSNDTSGGTALIGENQLQGEVDAYGINQVKFILRNEPDDTNISDAPCFIAQVFFDMRNTGLFTSIASLIDRDNTGHTGVDFSLGANPSDLPGGNSAVPPFVSNTTLNSSADSPSPTWGVNKGEYLGIILNLATNKSFEDVKAAMSDTLLRIGLHVQGFDGGYSEGFVSTTREKSLVPEPTTIGLMLAGLGALATSRHRRTA